MRKKLDLLNTASGRLTVIGEAANVGNQRHVMAQCSCGSEPRSYRVAHISRAAIKSCGCLQDESRRIGKHHMADTPTYRSWSAMVQRCTNPNVERYPQYGGRGIKVCEAWLNFEGFLADMGARPLGLSLDRINNDKNYDPGNCRWASSRQQAGNRSTTRRVVFDGVVMPISAASLSLGLGEFAVSKRLKRGWSPERALEGRGTLL